MKLLLTPGAAEDLEFWQATDPAFAEKIRQILHKLKHGQPLPCHQISKLPLKLSGLSAIRVSAEHRIVFERLADEIIVHQCRFHI